MRNEPQEKSYQANSTNDGAAGEGSSSQQALTWSINRSSVKLLKKHSATICTGQGEGSCEAWKQELQKGV
jgi:hypothetical protein